MRKVKKVFDRFSSVLNGISAALLIVGTILGTVCIICRYVFKNAIVWGDEGNIFLFIWMLYFAMCSVTYEGSHLNTNVIGALTHNNKTVALILRFFVFALTAYIGFVVIKAGIKPVRTALTNGRRSDSGFFPMGILYTIVPISFSLNILTSFFALIKSLVDKDSEKKEDKPEC